jgi:Flp pilus assembly protein TadG
MSHASYCRCRSGKRRGAAVAELAICLPLLVLLVFASIEACSMIFLEHGLSIASYEGVRAGISYDATNADVMSRCNEIINQRSIAGATVSTNPGNVANVQKGQPITVTVSAPSNANMISPPWFFGGMTLTARTTMVKE